jgi:hypothetical protein
MLGLGCLAGQAHFESETTRLEGENENNINSCMERKEPTIKRCHVETHLLENAAFSLHQHYCIDPSKRGWRFRFVVVLMPMHTPELHHTSEGASHLLITHVPQS